MTAVRAVLIATIILALAAVPLVAPAFGGAFTDGSTAYAAFGGGVGTGDPTLSPSQKDNKNQNNNDNNDDNNNDNNDDNNNDNNDGNNNDNNDGNNNGNNNDHRRGRRVVVVVRTPNESFNRPTKCFDTRELGTIQLGTGSFDVTVQVMPHSSFGQTTRLTLRRVGSENAPGPIAGGTLIDNVVFQLVAQSSCDGTEIGMLPNTVNMGIIYNVTTPVDKSKLQIVRWTGSAWTNVDTVPDPIPGNPYVSTSTNQAGIYALIQKP